MTCEGYFGKVFRRAEVELRNYGYAARPLSIAVASFCAGSFDATVLRGILGGGEAKSGRKKRRIQS
jgi:hypothetical protein